MKREKNLHFLRMAVMIAIGVPAACMTVRAAEIPAAPAEDDMAFRMAGVTVEAKRPDWESKLSPGTVTVIRPEEFKGEQKDLADFLKMVPGVHVREVNGKGQYTVVTVRGSTAAQVGVFVDGILTNLGGRCSRGYFHHSGEECGAYRSVPRVYSCPFRGNLHRGRCEYCDQETGKGGYLGGNREIILRGEKRLARSDVAAGERKPHGGA